MHAIFLFVFVSFKLSFFKLSNIVLHPYQPVQCVCVRACVRAYLSTHTVYWYKIQFLHYFGRIWPYWKMDTGKHNFLEILLLF